MPRSRPTKDIDFLAERVKNDAAELEHIFGQIAVSSCDDGVSFDPKSITSEIIKEDADYEGIRLKIDAHLGQARKKLQLDIGFGDIIRPQATLVKFPTLLEEVPPKIKVYSIESIVSEKFERRKTPLPDKPLVFRTEFHEDRGRQQQWAAFLRKSRLDNVSREFNKVMERITTFLKPIVVSIRDGNVMDKSWDAKTGKWRSHINANL